MSAFQALFAGQKRAQKLQRKSLKCRKCSFSTNNAGAFATHVKSHPVFKSGQKNPPKSGHSNDASSATVLDLLEEKRNEVSHDKPAQKLPNPKSRKLKSSDHVKTRVHFSNIKKYKLILHYELLRDEHPETYADDFTVSTSKII